MSFEFTRSAWVAAIVLVRAASTSADDHAGEPAHQSLPTKPVLSLEAAKRAADACEEMAREKQWKINIAIVDDGAHLVLFRHMPGSALISREIAIRKAETAAKIPRPTRALGERAYGTADQPAAAPGLAALGDLVLFPGGLPIKRGETPIGAIGVSGVTADQDEVCAQAGLDAIAPYLAE
jgi:uncharacterized protein GlcG (DUF336 family)